MNTISNIGKTYIFGLCEGRHSWPVKEGIFPHTVEHINDVQLEDIAEKRIPADCARLAVYVSGLTIAMLAVVKVCARRGIRLTAYHYNPTSNVFSKQEVL